MKKINATTTYNPNLSTMQEIEYTMPQDKKSIANCLMNALDNLKDQQAEIDELASATIDFIDQMRVQGCEGYTLPAEYDTLVDVVNKYRGR